MTTVEVFAPAKINLALHVTGQRADGYHLLDTLVAFADVGDRVRLTSPGDVTLRVTGPEGDPALATDTNILWHVAANFWTPDRSLALHLEKNLPVAAGIGGGSADAAACYRGLAFLRGLVEGREPAMPAAEDAARLLGIGADIPMCVPSEPARVRGIGEAIDPVPGLPELEVVLVNPRVPVSTPAIFKALNTKDNPPLDDLPLAFSSAADLVDWLAGQRNDLAPVAMAGEPLVAEVEAVLRAEPGALLARMSGSGATCFGIFGDAEKAADAAQAIREARPRWWVTACRLNAPLDVAPRQVS